jgi:hypothetical protein
MAGPVGGVPDVRSVSMPGGARKVVVPRGRVRSDLDGLEHCKDEQCVESSAGHVMEVFRKRMRIAARAQMRILVINSHGWPSPNECALQGGRCVLRDESIARTVALLCHGDRPRVAVAGALLLELVPRSRTAGLRADDDARLPALGLSGYA